MNIELLSKLNELKQNVKLASIKVEVDKVDMASAQASLAAFIEANAAGLAEIRAAIPGGEAEAPRKRPGRPRKKAEPAPTPPAEAA